MRVNTSSLTFLCGLDKCSSCDVNTTIPPYTNVLLYYIIVSFDAYLEKKIESFIEAGETVTTF